ncbi:MAG: 50S ribosomal protein L3 [Chlamydiota bacterium]
MRDYKMGLLGMKLGMTQVFTDDGKAVQVTVIQAGPCTVVQLKNGNAGGYHALQLGFNEGKAKSFTKPLLGHFTKAGTPPFKFLREVRVSGDEFKNFTAGQVIGAAVFQEGEFVDVCGVSKGKGFAGVIKRHHFHGFDAGHGTHECFRHGGSVGQHSFPGRVFKGLGMAGQMGNARATVQNLKVVKVLDDKNILLIGGAVPGANGAYLVIKKALKKKSKAAAKK